MEATGDDPTQDWRQRFGGKHCSHLGRGCYGVESAEQAHGINLCVVRQAGLVELEPDLPSGKVCGLDGRAELAGLVGLAFTSTSPQPAKVFFQELLFKPHHWNFKLLTVQDKIPAPRAPTVTGPNANKPARVVSLIDVYPERVDCVLKLCVNEVGPAGRGRLRAEQWLSPHPPTWAVPPPGPIVPHDKSLREVPIGGELAWPEH